MKHRAALLVGASYSAAPILSRLRRRGLLVTVCGKDPSDPCHQYADESLLIDYADRDELFSVVRERNFDFIIPSCNDTAYNSSSWVAAKTGHPGYDSFDVTKALHLKDRFRELTARLGIQSPRAVHDLTSLRLEDLPILIKPVDSFSGRGLTKVASLSDLNDAILRARSQSPTGAFVAEQFIDGNLHSHSAFIVDQEIVCDWFVDEFCTVYPYQVDCSNHPSALSSDIRQRIRSEISKLVLALGLVNGLIHTQFLSKGEDFWLIETMRRSPGDLYGGLIERSTGIDYIDAYVACFLGERPTFATASITPRYIGRHTISVSAACAPHGFSVNFPGRLTGIIMLKPSGTMVAPAPMDKLAIIFNEFESLEQMFATVSGMSRLVDLEDIAFEGVLL